ncbi:unnamed protein product [Callosobruchus maculatus]|uniref:Uncharacterized protein n=1 Tax=Callosobruchus maculatus TaxID=64391 RepID=A0A653BIQ8_CALMS|nr:unnamed protein product [Callosobruchus maculatus]
MLYCRNYDRFVGPIKDLYIF